MNPNFIRQATAEEQAASDAAAAERARKFNQDNDPFFTDDATGRLDDDGAPPADGPTVGEEQRPLQPPAQGMRSAPPQRGQSAPTRHR